VKPASAGSCSVLGYRGVVEVLDALRSELARRADVELAIVFGSFARGESGPTSDVDLAVAGPDVDRLALAAELALLLGREVDVVSLDTDDIVLLGEIIRDGRVIHEGRPGASARFRARGLSTLETDRPWLEIQQRAFLAHLASGGRASND